MDQAEIVIVRLFSVLGDAIGLIEYLLGTQQSARPMSGTNYQQAMEQVSRIKRQIFEIKTNLSIVDRE